MVRTAASCAAWPSVMVSLAVGGGAQRRQPRVGLEDDAAQCLLEKLRFGETEAALGMGFGGLRGCDELDHHPPSLLGEGDARMRIVAAVQLRKTSSHEACDELVRHTRARAPEDSVELGDGAIVTDAQNAEHEPLPFGQAMAFEVALQAEEQLKVRAPEQKDEEILAEAAVGVRRFGRRNRRGACDRCGVAAAVEDERRTVEMVEGLHFSDEDHVIAAFVFDGRAALKSRRASIEQRYVAATPLDGESRELVGSPGGERVGQLLLRGGEHVNREVAAVEEGRQALG